MVNPALIGCSVFLTTHSLVSSAFLWSLLCLHWNMIHNSNEPVFGLGSLARRVLSHVQDHGDSTFLRYLDSALGVQEFTYRDFITEAMIASHLFDQFGIPPGATVVLVLSSPKDVFVYETAALLTGRIPIISAHPSSKLSVNDFARTLLPVIDSAEPDLIIGDSQYCRFLSAAIGRRVASPEDLRVPQVLPQVVETGNPKFFIQYSSGTTGTKKGVVISQEQLLWQVDAYADAIRLTREDHIVSWLPFYHDMGLITALMMPLLTGTAVSLISAFDWVKDPLILLKAISRDQGTLCWLPNFSYNFLAQAMKRENQIELDLSSLRGVVNCSEPISQASHDLFMEAFEGHGFAKSAFAASYAMAETTFAITSGGFDEPLVADHVDRKSLEVGKDVFSGDDALVSSGKILSGTSVRIIDAQGNELPDRAIGEIAVSSPSIMRGYYKNLSDTLSAQADGYFKTGDLGYRDGEDLFVTGRVKDLIITAGRNIYPQDLETIINDIPDVIPGRCVALGVNDAAKGTESVVVIAETALKDSNQILDLSQVIRHEITVRFEVALADVLLVDPGWLKKSTSGKIARSANKQKYLETRIDDDGADVSNLTSQQQLIRECIFGATGSWVNDVKAPLITSGLVDSLALTTLMLELEKALGRDMPLPDDVGFDAYDNISSIEALTVAETPQKANTFTLVIDRRTKVGYVLESDRRFNTLIFGSSRSYLVQARHANSLGHRAFQFSVAGVRAEEFFCMTKLIDDVRKTRVENIVVGIDPTQFAPHLPLDLRFTETTQLARYLEAGELEGQHGLGVEEEAAVAERSERLSKRIQMYYQALDVDSAYDPKSGDITRLWGHHVETMEKLYYSFDEKKLADHFLLAHKCAEFHPRRLHYFKRFIELVRDMEGKLIIFTNPLNSKVFKKFADETPYAEAQERLLKWLDEVKVGDVSIHPFETPKDFGGFDHDYFDGTHMGRHSGDRLLDYVLPKR